MDGPTSSLAADGMAFYFTFACKPPHLAEICLQHGAGIIKVDFGVHPT